MLNLQITWGPFLAVALLNFVLGWLWYSPLLFAGPWAKALKIKMGKMDKKAKQKMPYLFAGAIFSSLAISFTLQILTQSLNMTSFGSGVIVGLLTWLGFSVPTTLGSLWEGKPTIVVIINLGNSIVAYSLMGGILASWH